MCPSWKQGKLLVDTWEKTVTPQLYGGRIQPMKTTNIEHSWIQLKANDWPELLEQVKKLHSAEFYQASDQQQVGNGERSNVVVQTKTHEGSITTTQTTPKSAKSPTKQLLHKSPIHPPKSIKDRLKKLV